MTDEQINDIFQSVANDDPEVHFRFARAILAADRAQQAVPKVVAAYELILDEAESMCEEFQEGCPRCEASKIVRADLYARAPSAGNGALVEAPPGYALVPIYEFEGGRTEAEQDAIEALYDKAIDAHAKEFKWNQRGWSEACLRINAAVLALSVARAPSFGDRPARPSELAVAVDLLRSTIAPLEVTEALDMAEDGGAEMRNLLDDIRRYLDHYDTDRTALAAAAAERGEGD